MSSDKTAAAAEARGDDATETGGGEAVPIVGIGASAGGLEALKALLHELPNDIGMAFLVVQHLSPDHESMLSEILARETELRVQEAEDETRLEPNHVYVAPAGHTIAVRASRLRVAAASVREKAGRNGGDLPVDQMLQSLAEEADSSAIGVVLSGTAADGTLGLKAIKAAGGITFAQDESSAEHFGMPGNAIACGAVDFVRAPAEIARELTRIARHPYVLDAGESALSEDPGATREQMKQVFALLRNRTGHDFSYYKHTTIKRRIKRRMMLSKREHFHDYLEHLKSEHSEIDALFQDITINVTGFFREPQTFDAVRDLVLPQRLRDRAPNDALRIWVPGCSTGEEPYSLAITLLEQLGPKLPVPVQIFGTDIDAQAIARARAGVYPGRISNDISSEHRHRFFHEVADGLKVEKPVRRLCVFAVHDVTRDPPFSRIDLILCRNLLIYLGKTLQRRVLQTFHYALKPDGYLLLGASEGIGVNADLFRLEQKQGKLYSKQSSVTAPAYANASGAKKPEMESQHNTASKGRSLESELKKQADQAVLALFSPPGVIVDRKLKVLGFRGKIGRYLDPVPGTASLDLVKLVRQELLVQVRNLFKRALKSDVPVAKAGVDLKLNGRDQQITLRVVPLAKDAEERFYLILFEGADAGADGGEGIDASATQPSVDEAQDSQTNQTKIAKIQQELEETREYMQSIIEDQEGTNEELQSANEEVQSTNEELRSTNEELETAKEELQSANEELATVNEELEHRNAELEISNNDLCNLLISVNLPILMLDQELRVRQCTPRAKRMFNLADSDIGRPIGRIRPNALLPNLEALAREVIEEMTVRTVEIRGEDDGIKDVILRPYRTRDQRIDGVVITCFDRSAPDES